MTKANMKIQEMWDLLSKRFTTEKSSLLYTLLRFCLLRSSFNTCRFCSWAKVRVSKLLKMLSAAWALLIGMPALKGSMSSGLTILGRDGSRSLDWKEVPRDLGEDEQGKFCTSVMIILYRLIFWLDGQNLKE